MTDTKLYDNYGKINSAIREILHMERHKNKHPEICIFKNKISLFLNLQ